jgi:ribosome-associated heat shock protein Hsp15
VRINNSVAKASSLVTPGDRISWKDPRQAREVQVVELLPRRVGAPEAAKAFIDHSAPLPPKEDSLPVRDRGSGRPEKRDRRDLDRLRGYEK